MLTKTVYCRVVIPVALLFQSLTRHLQIARAKNGSWKLVYLIAYARVTPVATSSSWMVDFIGKRRDFAGPIVSRVKVAEISIQFCQVVHWSTKWTRKLEGDLRRYGALDHSSKRDSPCHTLLSRESRPSMYVSCNCWLVSFKSHIWDALHLRQIHTLKVCFPRGSSKVWLGSHAGHVLMSDRHRIHDSYSSVLKGNDLTTFDDSDRFNFRPLNDERRERKAWKHKVSYSNATSVGHNFEWPTN